MEAAKSAQLSGFIEKHSREKLIEMVTSVKELIIFSASNMPNDHIEMNILKDDIKQSKNACDFIDGILQNII